MNERQPSNIGKINLKTFESFIMKRLGKKDDNVLVSPLTGEDASVIDIGAKKVLVIAEDPIFNIPGQSLQMFGWYTVHIGASDVAVMGVKPKWMTYTLIMPPQTNESDFEEIVDSIHKTALELDISIVGGHTGYYPGFASPTIGGITVFGTSDKNSYVTSSGAEPGNDVILTKGPAIEAVGILANLKDEELLNEYSPSLVNKAKSYAKKMSVVQDALTAMETGGVTSMHDATEGGVIGGLFEVSNASGVGMEINEDLFIYPEEVHKVCEYFKIDPIASIAEGSLLITSRPGYSDKILEQLKKINIDASVIGSVTDDISNRFIKRKNGKRVPLEIPAQDPFWPVFFQALGE